MFRIVFIREKIHWEDEYRGFIFEPNKKAIPFDFYGYKIWSPSFHAFILIQKNIFLTLETLFHEIGHLVIYGLFFHRRTADLVGTWYDYAYWRLLRLWRCD